ncbi:MAG: hypothetical protein DHS20C05_18480 [Hyphococcus sp.]|nr:MAG: hypothetical protein DHS20C05_18480 [Marinicaulis sp.]
MTINDKNTGQQSGPRSLAALRGSRAPYNAMRFLTALCAAIVLTGCAMPENTVAPASVVSAPVMTVEALTEFEERARQEDLLDRYFEIYKAKDVEAMLSLYDEGIVGVLYPTTLFGRGIDAARPGIEGDFAGRPEAYAQMPHRFRIARDKWATFGESINGDERAPLMIIFDLNEAGDKIEATYTQIAAAMFIDGPSVEEPTDAMRASFAQVFEALSTEGFAAAAAHFANEAALYAYPPTDLQNFGPVITGASDVASVLAFKWGEGAWRDDAFVSQYMQYVFVGISGRKPGQGLERAALFTFDADPASPSFEKIIRVDVMGPPGAG